MIIVVGQCLLVETLLCPAPLVMSRYKEPATNIAYDSITASFPASGKRQQSHMFTDNYSRSDLPIYQVYIFLSLRTACGPRKGSALYVLEVADFPDGELKRCGVGPLQRTTLKSAT